LTKGTQTLAAFAIISDFPKKAGLLPVYYSTSLNAPKLNLAFAYQHSHKGYLYLTKFIQRDRRDQEYFATRFFWHVYNKRNKLKLQGGEENLLILNLVLEFYLEFLNEK